MGVAALYSEACANNIDWTKNILRVRSMTAACRNPYCPKTSAPIRRVGCSNHRNFSIKVTQPCCSTVQRGELVDSLDLITERGQIKSIMTDVLFEGSIV